MAPHHCGRCGTSRAVVKRPKDSQLLCKDCFLRVFEDEVHHTITASGLFLPGDKVAIGASGGKDSTVLASVLKTLNDRYHYGLELSMLSIDEGIKGYRDDSLQTVKRNSIQYGMPLHILGYEQIYGWTMDQVVETTGRKGNCTYCGVFRRQALDRGVKLLGIAHLVTGHNADDMAETILMNLLRGDLPRLARGTRTITNTITNDIRRSKPLKYSYEKEIVLYAHHKGLDYFSTECIYSPEAFRGTARTLIKALERIRSSIILDIVRSGEDMSILVDTGIVPARRDEQMVENPRPRKTPLPHTHQMQQLADQSRADQHFAYLETDMTSFFRVPQKQGGMKTPWHDSDQTTMKPGTPTDLGIMSLQLSSAQALGSCLTCGYMSSQPICQACRLLETLNNNRAEMQLQQQVG